MPSRGRYIANPDTQPGKPGQVNQQARENQEFDNSFRVQSGRHQRQVVGPPYQDWHDGANLMSSDGLGGPYNSAVIARGGVVESGNRQAADGLSVDQIDEGDLRDRDTGVGPRFGADGSLTAAGLGYGVGMYGEGPYGE